MNGLLAMPCQPFKDRPASRIGKSLEDVICYSRHEKTITKWLLVVKPNYKKFARGNLLGCFRWLKYGIVAERMAGSFLSPGQVAGKVARRAKLSRGQIETMALEPGRHR
jgi:hypothetical protein